MVRRRRSCSQLSIQVTLPTSRSIMRSPLERIPPQGSPMPRLLPFTFIFRFLCVCIQYIGSCVTKSSSSSSSSWRRSKSEGRNDGSFFDSMSRRLVLYSVAAGRMSARTESAPSPSNGCIQWHLNGSRGCKQQKIFDFIRLCTFAHSDRNETCLTRGKFNEGKGNQLRETKGKWMKEEGKRNRPRSLEKKRRNNWSRPLPLRDSHATDAVDNTETLLPRLNNKSLSFRLSPCALSCCSFPFFFFFSWRATSLYWEGRAITKSPLPLNGNQLDKSSRCCCCFVFLGFFSFLVQ